MRASVLLAVATLCITVFAASLRPASGLLRLVNGHEAIAEGYCVLTPDNPWCPAPDDYIPPPLPEDDQVEVYYMQAPLMESVLSDLLGDVDLYHTGIGFRSLKTGQNATVELDAVYSIQNATFPFVYAKPNGDHDLVYCDRAGICAMNSLSHRYWQLRLKIATVSGTAYNRFMKEWLPMARAQPELFTNYRLWNVFGEWPTDWQMKSVTCADFAWAAMGALEDYGMEISTPLPCLHDYGVLYGTYDQTPANLTDPTVSAELLEYFDSTELHDVHAIDFVEHLIHFVVSDKWIPVDGALRRVVSKKPYVYYHWAVAPICSYEVWLADRCGHPLASSPSTRLVNGAVEP